MSRDAEGRVTIRAVRIRDALVLDGRIDEEIYRAVPPISDFVQQEPSEGEPATERTDAWILFDDHTLYVSAICWDSHPERMISNELRRDNAQITQNENFVVDLDTFHDGRNGFFFETNPLGAVRDGLVMNERDANFDWNTVWDVRATVFDRGWMLEMAIPFKSLRYRSGPNQMWGVVLRRGVKWKNENSFLTPIPASYGGRGIYKFSSAATLVGLEVPATSINLEVKPYAISGIKTDRMAVPAIANDVSANAGVDAKYGITQGLTADFTYNTDFAQVEDDEQQINLTRFSVFYPEKREFFLEGQGLFDFGGAAATGSSSNDGPPNLMPVVFFSRRIGLAASHTIPIRGGGRMTGRVGPYSLGVLNIETGDSRRDGETATNFSVVRVRRDILKRSTIGLLATNRTASTEGGRSNQALGFDANFALSQDVEVKTYYARTRAGDRTTDGTSYRGLFNYAGDRYGLIYERLVVGDGFDPAIGFLRRTDFRRDYAQARFSPRPTRSRSIRKYTFQTSLDYIADTAGFLDTREAQATFAIDLHNSDNVTVEYSDRFERLVQPFEIATDVVVPIGRYAYRDVYSSYKLGSQHRIAGTVSVKTGSLYGGDRTEVGYSSGRVDVTSHLSIEPRLSVSRVALPEGSFTATLAGGRVSYTMTPRMMAAALVQYNSTNQTASANIRFRWEYRPGSDVFVVYSEGRDTTVGAVPILQNRGFVVKFTRLFRM